MVMNSLSLITVLVLVITGIYFPFKIYKGKSFQSNFVRSLENLKHISSTVTNDSTLFVGDFNVDLNQECPTLTSNGTGLTLMASISSFIRTQGGSVDQFL